MRILHLCLAAFYIDNYSYQENHLTRIHKEDGNEVLVIASTETYVDNINLGYVEPSEYVGEDGVRVKRIPYAYMFTHYLATKIRKYVGLTKAIEDFKPDVIFSHDLCFYSVLEVINYLKKNPHVRFFADTHTAAYNSGLNWVSKNILHKIIYKHLIHKALSYVEKYFYIGENEKMFSKEIYKVPEELLEFYPLGGIIPDQEEYDRKRAAVRKALGIKEDELLFMHSGKMTKQKKTVELLSAFSKADKLKAKMVIVGSVSDEIKNEFEAVVSEDPRIIYLGWKKSSELAEYLYGCDLYCQPGSVSVTLQNAVCTFVPVMTYPHLIYQKIDLDNFLWVRDENEMLDVFEGIASGKIDISCIKEKTKDCANTYLDYKNLARRIY